MAIPKFGDLVTAEVDGVEIKALVVSVNEKTAWLHVLEHDAIVQVPISKFKEAVVTEKYVDNISLSTDAQENDANPEISVAFLKGRLKALEELYEMEKYYKTPRFAMLQQKISVAKFELSYAESHKDAEL